MEFDQVNKKMIMIGLIYIALGLLLNVQTAYTVDQTPKSCGNEEMRKAAIDEALAALNCDHYNCGKINSMYTCSMCIF